jgi:polar amino acid transport system substrate-binding protein
MLALPACGANDDVDDQDTAPVEVGDIRVDEDARALLPETVAERGTLRVGADLAWPPFTYQEVGEPVGIDVELITAIGDKLGLDVVISDVGITAVVPSIQNGRFDVAVGQIVNSPERRAAVSFVNYIENSLGLIVREADADTISPEDICGHTLVATKGTGPLSFGQQYSKDECVAKGKPPVKFEIFDDSGGTLLALANSRGDGFLADAAVGLYTAENSESGLIMDDGLVPGSANRSGIVHAQDNGQLGDAVRAALLSLVADGGYQEILDKWGIGDQALTEAEISDEAGS